MTRVEICGTEVIIGRVNVRQRRNGKTLYRDMQRYEQRQLGELNKRDVFFNCLPNNDLSKKSFLSEANILYRLLFKFLSFFQVIHSDDTQYLTYQRLPTTGLFPNVHI